MIIKTIEKSHIAESLLRLKEYFDETNKKREFKKTWNEKEARDILEGCIERPDSSLVLGAWEKCQIIGIMVLSGVKTIFEGGGISAVEIVWHSNIDLSVRKRREVMFKLLEKAETWAKENLIKTIFIGLSKGSSLTKRLIKRKYKEDEIFLKKAVD